MTLETDSFKRFEYLQANEENNLWVVHEKFNAYGVIKLAGSGSLYVH